MNKEEIDKWLYEKYGCSYTRLEELHDFYFEKYTDLKEENQQLKEELKATKEVVEEHLRKEIQYKEVIEEVREVINKMIYTGYMLEKDNSATQFMATNKTSEFGVRAEVLLQILDKGERDESTNPRS